jgi:serine/threonine protein kinase/tetratricopeptide (TPR) repeat protein
MTLPKTMTPERWRQISAIFSAARLRDPAEQATFIAEACGDDQLLASEVESLLAAEDSGGIGSLASPRPPGSSSQGDDRPTQVTADGSSSPGLPSSQVTAFARGRYVVTRVLGEGGQKRVYLTCDTHLDREVVIAVLKPKDFNQRGMARLQFEARALARLGDHPHIVTVHDIGEERGQPYIVTQYVEGGSLDALQGKADRRLAMPEALRIGSEVCQALSYAHARGIVHRDVKPGNIWLTRQGTAKLGDFGLAAGLDLSRVTAEGQLLGTSAYMSPEQALGQDVGARADLYSLGIVLYELVAGRRPFIGDTIAAVISQHLHARPVAPSWHNAEVPPALDALILRLLEKRPQDRPETAKDVADALDTIRRDPSGTAADKTVRPLERLAGGVFVGRRAESEQLRAAFHASLAGTGSIVQIVGEPGSGKTSLAEQFLTYAQLRGADVLRSHCHESEGAPAYWPWVQLLRSYVSTRSTEHLLSTMGEGASAIVALDAELRKRLPGLAPGPQLEPEQARFRLFDSVTSTFKTASVARPLVIFIDDLQWADAASLRLLQFFAREIRHAKLLVVATLRPGQALSPDPLAQAAGALASQDANRRVLLRGLAEDEVARFIEMTIASAPSERLVRSVQRRTEGNPFFVKEVVRLLVAEGRLLPGDHVDSTSIPLPETVREVITGRLGQVSEECRALLATASVIGDEFDLAVLRRTSDVPPDRVLEGLEHAIDALLITEVKPAGTYGFAHALIRETLYESMGATRRMQLHRRIGAVLESASLEKVESLSGRLAFHFFEAIPLGEVDKAMQYAVQAGERANRLLAYEEAAGHYEMALRALEHQEPQDESRRAELLLALGEAHLRAGLPEQARESFTRAAELAKARGAFEAFGLAVLGLSAGAPVGARLGHAIDQAEIGRLQEALDRIPEGDGGLRVRLLAQLALALYHEPARRVALSLEAVEISRRVNDSPALLAALYSRCVSLEGFDQTEERLALATEMVRVADAAGDVENALRGHYRCYRELMELGDIEGVERQLEAYTRLATRIRQPRYLWYVHYCSGALALLRGDFREATHAADQALAIGLRVHDPNAPLFCGLVKYSCLFHQGSFAEMEPLLLRSIERYPSTIGWRVQLAQLYYLMDRKEEARHQIEALGERDFDDLPIDGSFVITLGALMQVLRYLNDVRRAARIYERLQPYARFNQIAGNSAICGAPVTDALGVAATTLARWDEAAKHFEDALAVEVRMGARPWMAWTLCSYAQMLQARGRAGDRERALTLLRDARSVSLELGMKWVAQWAESRAAEPPQRH